MMELVLVGVGLVFLIIFYMLVKVMVNDEEQTMKDFHYCYGCQAGWCTFTPASKECKKWKAENERGSHDKRNEESDP